MNRWIASLVVAAVAAVVIAGAAAAAPAGVVTAQTDAPNGSGADSGGENATADLSPGERLAGVVGVQGAEIEGEVESRAFEVGLREAESNESRAAVVAERLNRTEERLAELEQRQQELRERRAAGELSRGEYAARMATTTARIETLSRGLNRSASAAAELPAAVRNETGVDDERLATLRQRASELSGPEVAAIARGVAGEDVGGPVAPGRGPPANGTDRGPSADAGPPGEGAPGGVSGNGSVGPPGAGSGNGSIGAPGAGPGNGSVGGSGSGSAGPPDSGSANGSNPSDQPGSGNATGGGTGNASTGPPAGPGSEGSQGEGGPSGGGAGGNGTNGGADAPSVGGSAISVPTVAEILSLLGV
jgi:hypothetical protein